MSSAKQACVGFAWTISFGEVLHFVVRLSLSLAPCGVGRKSCVVQVCMLCDAMLCYAMLQSARTNKRELLLAR